VESFNLENQSDNGAQDTECDALNVEQVEIENELDGEQESLMENEGLQSEAQPVQENTEVQPDNQNDSDDLQNLTQLTISTLEAELEREREARLLTESKLLCIELLEKEHLPKSLAEYLTFPDPEKTKEVIEGIGQIVRRTINRGILSRLATVNAPTRSKNEMTREEFQTLSLAQRQQIFKTDRQLYNQLTSKN
jgi:hypothetical protein